MVKAKFRCIEKTSSSSCKSYGEAKPADSERVKLAAVMGKENSEWSQYTPSGSLEMTIDNPAALEQFVVGKEYILTFEPA